MTNEEAIIYLESLRIMFKEDCPQHTALEMAIKALETVSCIKEKCAYCPHCENCDVDDETLVIKSLESQKGIPVSEKSCNTCGQECAIKYHGCSNWIPNTEREDKEWSQ